MVDLKPPRLAGDDRAVLCALLQYHRESVVRKTEGIDDEAASRRMVATGTSLLWLLKHLARAETVWFLVRFGGRDIAVPDDAVQPGDTVAAAVAAYRQVWDATDAEIAAASLDELCRRPEPDLAPVNLRWVLAHLVEETARHAGHADILRELIDGRTGR